MLSVSTEFQEAIRQPHRQTSIRGTLYIRKSGGTEAYDFGDSAVIQKSLVIKDQLTNGKFGYGGAYIRNLSVKLDSAKIGGLEPFNINLTGAEILLWFTLILDDGTPEEVFLGSFFINSKDSSRKFDILSLIGEDCLTKLDVTSEAMTNATPYQICKRACELAGLSLANTQQQIAALPNGSLSVSFDTSQIQTARDMIMWAAKLTGTFIRAKRQVEPCVELVQIPKKYTARDETAGQFSYNFDLDAFIADNGSIIPADLRRSTDYTDTSVRITGLTTDFSGERVTIKKSWTFAPDTLEGMMEVENNPLLNGKTSAVAKDVLTKLVDYTEELRFCPFKITFSGNPAIQVGDFVYLEPGGGLDDMTYRHYGIVTFYKWVYDGDCEIRCSSDVAAERPDGGAVSAASITSSAFSARAQAGSEINSIPPKSQLEKRLQSTTGNAVTDKLVATDGTSMQLMGGQTTMWYGANDQPKISLNPGGITVHESARGGSFSIQSMGLFAALRFMAGRLRLDDGAKANGEVCQSFDVVTNPFNFDGGGRTEYVHGSIMIGNIPVLSLIEKRTDLTTNDWKKYVRIGKHDFEL